MRRGTVTSALNYFEKNIDMMLISTSSGDFLEDVKEHHKSFCDYTRRDARRSVRNIMDKLDNYEGKYWSYVTKKKAIFHEILLLL